MVSDELKPKVLLCMLGDKVSNLLVNLGEEELKDYESLKQVVLKEKNFDKGQVTEIKKFACFTCGLDKHFKRDCTKNKEVDNKRLNENKVSTEGTELKDGTVTARVDLLGKVIPRGLLKTN
ncbi:hypothetical protein TNCV_4149651 [Trichonephila clavipes]|uniref:CCHC-type domain-containing protein n=1 Tax=Trichonephila clavipes TaxID=2585209 RepID=A0A8X7BFC5_TRICX|nr:hypothetical protein TNCV_4149651 [Trichonephila clavipes]